MQPNPRADTSRPPAPSTRRSTVTSPSSSPPRLVTGGRRDPAKVPGHHRLDAGGGVAEGPGVAEPFAERHHRGPEPGRRGHGVGIGHAGHHQARTPRSRASRTTEPTTLPAKDPAFELVPPR